MKIKTRTLKPPCHRSLQTVVCRIEWLFLCEVKKIKGSVIIRYIMLLCRISHHHCNIETTEDFVAFCMLIIIMLGIAVFMDYVRKQKAMKNAESGDVKISIEITCSNGKSSSKGGKSN